jgi:hypothetical protein
MSYHSTCFDQFGNHQAFEIAIDGDCCAFAFIVSIFRLWSRLCSCVLLSCVVGVYSQCFHRHYSFNYISEQLTNQSNIMWQINESIYLTMNF